MRARFALIILILLTACGTDLKNGSDPNNSDTSVAPGEGEPAARFIFHKDNFTDLSDFTMPQQTHFQCLGDVIKTFYPSGDDYNGAPIQFPASSAVDSLSPTHRPGFVKNVSVDVTQTYFSLTQPNVLQTDACSYRGSSGSGQSSACADFDDAPGPAPSPTVAPTPTVSPAPVVAATPTSPPYYGSQFYRVRDDWCTSQGPILNSGVEASKTYVGGVNIDLDRTKLGASEDLLMMITYHALNSNAAWPSVQGQADETILEVNLVGTTLGLDLLLGAKQPRAWSDYGSSSIPVYLKKIATLQDPVASLRTEQIYLPLSGNPLIDRIRIDRVRGSYHLYQIDLYRLGNRAN